MVRIENPQMYVPSEAGVDGVRYMFHSYTPSESITVDGNKNITLVYKTQYKLTMSASPSDGGTTNPLEGTHWYDNNTLVTISATASNGYRFDSWAGSGLGSYSGTNSSANITMNGPINETANFVALATVTFSAIGFSTDASSPVLTVDSNNYTYFDLPKDFTWDVDTSHNFTWSDPVSSTTPGKRYIWNSTVGLSTSQSGSIKVPSDGGWINATYKTQYLLTIGVSPLEAGTTNPPPGNYWHYNGSSVLVLASVSTGYTFSHWLLDGENVGSNNPINVTTNEPHNLTAILTGPSYQLTYTKTEHQQ